MAAHSRLLTALCFTREQKPCCAKGDMIHQSEQRDVSSQMESSIERFDYAEDDFRLKTIPELFVCCTKTAFGPTGNRELLHSAWLDRWLNKHQPSRFISGSLFFIKSHIFLFIFSYFSHLRALTCIQLQHKPGAQPGLLNKGAMWGPLNIQRRHNKTKSHKCISEMLLCCCCCKMTI